MPDQPLARDTFDRLLGVLHGLPDVTTSRESTVRAMLPLIASAQTYIIQTYRQREKGDTVFLECISAEGSIRLALPPQVTEVIARQRDALTAKVRSKTAKAAAEDRKRRGVQPGFMRTKKQK